MGYFGLSDVKTLSYLEAKMENMIKQMEILAKKMGIAVDASSRPHKFREDLLHLFDLLDKMIEFYPSVITTSDTSVAELESVSELSRKAKRLIDLRRKLLHMKQSTVPVAPQVLIDFRDELKALLEEQAHNKQPEKEMTDNDRKERDVSIDISYICRLIQTILEKGEPNGDNNVDINVVYDIDRLLLVLLQQEGVIEWEITTGRYDSCRQVVCAKVPTNHAPQHEFICGTVKPGYLFGRRVVEHQSVIIYDFQEDESVAAE